MDYLVLNQRRVRISGSRRYNGEEDTEQRRYFSSQTSQDYDAEESEFGTAVAAAAFAVYSLDQAELQHQRMRQEALENSRSRPNRLLSNYEPKTAGEFSMKSSIGGQEDRVSERAPPARQPSHALSAGQATPADRYQMQKGTSPGHDGVKSNADAWEKAQMKKVQRRYEKTKFEILAWENEKKMQAKLKMENMKTLLEQRKAQNMQHYQNKVVSIEQMARGARAQLEEKRRNEELAVKEKAKKIRSGGNVPVKCFCF